MTRPRRSENTRARLIEQGIELVSEQGYHGTGLKQILDAVKVPKGSFYNYFESKEHFAAEIISAYFTDLIQQLDAYLATNDADPRMTLQAVYGIMIEHLEEQGCEKGCLIGNMAAEVAASSEACQKALRDTVSRWKTRIVALFEQGQSQGQFRQDISADELADIYWNTWEGGILRMKIDGQARGLRHSLDLVLNVLFKPSSEVSN